MSETMQIKIISVINKLLYKIKEEGIFPNSLSEANKWDKDITRKESYKPISFMNKIDKELLNEILVNWIQQCIRRITHHDQGKFMQGFHS